MEGRQDIKRTGAWVASLIQPSVNEFVRLKLAEYGWFSTDEDNAEVARNITHLFLSMCLRAGNSEPFHVSFDGQAQMDFALEISTKFLSLDPQPDDPGLLCFVHSIFNFCQGFDWRSNEIFPGSLASESSSVSMDTQEAQPITNPEGILGRFFQCPAELRQMVYKEALTAPEGTLLRSFIPPPLLCASRRLRGEALPLFYKYNDFEITIQRSPQDQTLVGRRRLPSVDMRVWRRFLDMWNVFNMAGTNGLQYVERVTVIYRLSAKSGMPFGSEYKYDRRLGFRFTRTPIEEGPVEKHDEGSNAGNNRSGDGSDDNSSEDSDEDYEYGEPECNSVALNRGSTFDWPIRSETQRFLFEKMRACETGRLWEVHPLPRLANMLRRCARDCPRAAQNVDFLYPGSEPYSLLGYEEYGENDEESFYDPDDEDDEGPR